MLNPLVAAFGLEDHCDICGVDFTEERMVHADCLKKKHGGKMPEHFANLIKTFELDNQFNEVESALTATRKGAGGAEK